MELLYSDIIKMMKPKLLAEEIEVVPNAVCRFCFEPQDADNPLLIPCNCSGTVKYIHEACLKVWLISKEQNLDNVHCELCNTKYEMEFKFRKRCAPRELFHQSIMHWVFLPVLGVVLGLMLMVIWLIQSRIDSQKTQVEKAYTVTLLGACGLCCLVIVYMCFISVFEACIKEEMSLWLIESRSDLDESRPHGDASNEIIGDVSGELLHTGVLRVPLTVRVGLKTIKTPSFQSNTLMAISERGSVVAYTSRIMSERPCSGQQIISRGQSSRIGEFISARVATGQQSYVSVGVEEDAEEGDR
jgi:hypothetical protein